MALLLSIARATVAGEPGAPPIEARPNLEDRYPRASVSFGAVESYPDLVFSTLAGYRPLRLDLYRRRASPGPDPLVVYIHGGGWESGHPRQAGAFSDWPGLLASLAARGYVVASIEYRLSGEAPFPAAIHDVKRAVRWLRAHAREFGIEHRRVIVWGASAGAQLAALAATSCGVAALAPDGAPLTDDCVQGLVGWYGVFDLGTALSTHDGMLPDPIRRYLGCRADCEPALARIASPIAYVDAHDPPTLLIHGERDEVLSVDQSRRFHAALRERGAPATLLVLPDVGHSFVGLDVGSTRAASLVAVDRTFAFIDEVAGARP